MKKLREKKKVAIILICLIAITILITTVFGGINREVKQVAHAKEVKANSGMTLVEDETANKPINGALEESDNQYYFEDYWEWHTRTTDSDKAFNGKHIEIDPEEAIRFYGYGQVSYKDFLYKDYSYAGEKTFSFILDETKASYHTLDGAGFIFNAKKEDGKLSGYILLIKQSTICIYRIDDVDINTFETTDRTSVESYAGAPIASVDKKVSDIHQLIIKTSPTNITVIDNEEEILNVNLDYSKHVGESFGLISSYVSHDCPILTQIEFTRLKVEINNYKIPVLKKDENGNPLQGADFQVKNEKGDVVRQGTTGVDGIFYIEGLTQGIYTVEETKAPQKYAFKSNKITFKVTSDGRAVNVETGKEIKLEVENELLKIKLKKYRTGTTEPVEGAVIGLFDKNEKPILDEDGNQIKATSDKNGNIVFKNIEAGTYKYKELEAPKGYIANKKMYTCILSIDGSVTFKDDTKGIIYNDKVKEQNDTTNNNNNNAKNDTSTNINKNVEVKNSTVDNLKQGILPKAGTGRTIIILVMIITTISIYYAIKYKKID